MYVSIRVLRFVVHFFLRCLRDVYWPRVGHIFWVRARHVRVMCVVMCALCALKCLLHLLHHILCASSLCGNPRLESRVWTRVPREIVPRDFSYVSPLCFERMRCIPLLLTSSGGMHHIGVFSSSWCAIAAPCMLVTCRCFLFADAHNLQV